MEPELPVKSSFNVFSKELLSFSWVELSVFSQAQWDTPITIRNNGNNFFIDIILNSKEYRRQEIK